MRECVLRILCVWMDLEVGSNWRVGSCFLFIIWNLVHLDVSVSRIKWGTGRFEISMGELILVFVCKI